MEEVNEDSTESNHPSDISDNLEQEPILQHNLSIDSNEDNQSIESNQDYQSDQGSRSSSRADSDYEPPAKVSKENAAAIIDLMKKLNITTEDLNKAVTDKSSKSSSSASSKPSTIETDKDLRYKVTPPIFGGVSRYGKYQVAWTGGKPNCTWTGLEEPNPVNDNPKRGRTNDYRDSSNYTERQAGLFTQESLKFKSGDNLDFFIKKLFNAFTFHGMDSICYRLDPSDSTKTTVVNVFTQYPRLKQEQIKDQSEWVKARFDSYSKRNDEQARQFILNSVCSKLEFILEQKSSPGDTAVDLLLHLVEEERPVNFARNLVGGHSYQAVDNLPRIRVAHSTLHI